MSQKFSFYTIQKSGGYVGKCKEHPSLTYTPTTGNRDAALSGIKRMVIKLEKENNLPLYVAINPQPNVSLQDLLTTGAGVGPSHAPKKITENRIAFVIDRSSSMGALVSSVKAAYDANLKTIIDQSSVTGQRSLITTIGFNSRVHRIHANVSPSNAQIAPYHIAAEGMTALYDAVIEAVRCLESVPVDPNVDVSYLVITLTDGAENASTNSIHTFQQILRAAQMTDLWTFTFLVPPGQGSYISNRLGVPQGNVQEWEGTVRGVQQYTAANNAGLGGYFNLRTAGLRSSKTFYADASNISAAQAKANLVDIRRDVEIFTVASVGQIRDVCEAARKQPYVPGQAFYQLQKPEKVQHYKKVVIVDKASGSVYAGAAARQMLGIPNDGHSEVRVIPGSNGNYEIFIQSTSVNRSVYPGSKIVYSRSVI